jgi:alpha,alpha-trehalase
VALDLDPPFRPVERVDGQLLIEDHGLIGDGTTAALVGRDGSVSWLCVPRFDSPPLLCSLLDAERGGRFLVSPDSLRASRQRYLPDTGVLVTELQGPEGTVEVTDALSLRSGADLAEGVPGARHELVRLVEVTAGRVRLRVELAPRGGATAEHLGGGWQVRGTEHADLDLQLSVAGDGALEGLDTVLELTQGQRLDLVLSWGGGSRRFQPVTAREIVTATVEAWRSWMACFAYDGPQEPLVRRSAITLKMLDHVGNGAIVAAPTSSLPEQIGGERNWDYRYAWIRDAAFTVYALRRIGMTTEASAFLGWVLDVVEPEGRPKVLYDIDGRQPVPERTDPELRGYLDSPPVRWGNAAAEQRQHDVFGEILDCAYQWTRGGGTLDAHVWARLRSFVDLAAEEWDTPDHGIWEVRTDGQVFTYSAALCQVALDRGARLADVCDLPGDVERWRRTADRIREAILTRAWDDDLGSLTEHLGGGYLDASLLTLPLRRVLAADDPRMVATVERVADALGAGDGLLYRYLPDRSPDGLTGEEGAFLLCSFWLVDNLADQGRLDEAQALYDSLCDRANPLGLLPEQLDPETGRFLGNFPQAFSHVGVIASGVRLDRRRKDRM